MEEILSTITSIFSTISLLAPFLGVGVLLVAVHTFVIVSRTPPLRIHIPVAFFTYTLLFAVWATVWTLATRRHFEPSSATYFDLPRYPLSYYLIPSVYAIPSAIAALIAAIAGTHLYARSRLSSLSSRLSIAILALAVALAGFTLFMILFLYMLRITG